MMAQYPSRRIAELSYRYRTLGLGYANLGALLMARGLGYDSAGGRAIAGAIAAVMTGTAYATSAAMAESMGAFPGFAANRAAMLKVIRNHRRAAHGQSAGYEAPGHRAGRARYRQLPRRPPRRGSKKRLESGTCARRAARLPQRAGLGHRADRHDRAGDGLRYHRHRARLRSGEVQDAGRRRLLQDHQSDGAARAGHARLRRAHDERASWRMRSVMARSRAHRRSITRRSRRAASMPTTLARVEKALPTAFDIRFAFSRYTLGDDFCRETLGARRCGARRSAARSAGASRLLPQRHRCRERLRLRDDVDRKRARSEARASFRVRLCESLWTRWHALLVCGESHPHDGGSTTVHLRRDLKNDQHA